MLGCLNAAVAVTGRYKKLQKLALPCGSRTSQVTIWPLRSEYKLRTYCDLPCSPLCIYLFTCFTLRLTRSCPPCRPGSGSRLQPPSKKWPPYHLKVRLLACPPSARLHPPLCCTRTWNCSPPAIPFLVSSRQASATRQYRARFLEHLRGASRNQQLKIPPSPDRYCALALGCPLRADSPAPYVATDRSSSHQVVVKILTSATARVGLWRSRTTAIVLIFPLTFRTAPHLPRRRCLMPNSNKARIVSSQ